MVLREYLNWAILESSIVGPGKSCMPPALHTDGEQSLIKEKARILGQDRVLLSDHVLSCDQGLMMPVGGRV